MSSSENIQNKKTYSKYSREMRLKLIKLVEEDGISTAEAGRIVGIKQTSACRIINSYRKFNRIFERKADRLDRQAQTGKENQQKKEQKIMNNNHQNQALQKEASQIGRPSDRKLQMEKKQESRGQNLPQIFCPEFEHKTNFQVPLSFNLNIFNQWGVSSVFPEPFLWPRPSFFF